MTNIDIFGYFSMAVVLASMLFTSVVVLRLVNTWACALFVLYGFLIHSNPVIIMNILCIIINIFKLAKYTSDERSTR